MFSIFKKNVYLVDLIGGITDFHNHLLPGIDDGAKTVEESLKLIQEFKNIGIDKFIATPHVMGDFYPNSPETIIEAYNLLKPKIEESIKFSYAAEYMMDQHFVEIIENKTLLNIVDNKVLVELSYFQPPLNLNEILFKLQNNSYSPILAHPERYSYYHSKDLKKFEELKSRGCQFQLNMLSLSSHYGIGIQKTAFQLLEDNMIDFFASDVHRMDHIDKIKKIKLSNKYINKLKLVIEKNIALIS